MLLKVTHETTLDYTDLITETVMELRMAPRQQDLQRRLSFSLAIGPSAGVTNYFDWLGNMVHVFSIQPPHKEVKIVATSVVETRADHSHLGADRWPIPYREEQAFHDFLGFSTIVDDSPQLRELVASLRIAEGTLLSDVARKILDVIDEKFTYEKGVTSATTPVSDVLAHGRGVCQDFTHLMIAMARCLGIPARYVSGVIHSANGNLRGGAQTHAWCELFFPSGGWVGFDPTNKCVINGQFVTVALGRDYRDVPPNRGLYKGKAKEEIAVKVFTQEMHEVPSNLPDEQIERLGVATYPGSAAFGRMKDGRLEEQQQQQQQEQQQQQ